MTVHDSNDKSNGSPDQREAEESESQINDDASRGMRNTVKKVRPHYKNRYRLDLDAETIRMSRLISALHTEEETGTKDDEKLLFVVKLAIRGYFNGPFQDELKKLSGQR